MFNVYQYTPINTSCDRRNYCVLVNRNRGMHSTCDVLIQLRASTGEGTSSILTVCWFDYWLQLQDMRNNAARQTVEVTKSKDDCKDLRSTITDLRDRINKMDDMVSKPTLCPDVFVALMDQIASV